MKKEEEEEKKEKEENRIANPGKKKSQKLRLVLFTGPS